ncbi:hypothetical protein NC653_006059 [Populus alba x Populus x berolinensis]|uniref:Uncharacterized protein n=1 Tax=Populus alba x Populus x berolinensis TaxID=444605 RepID=A0AAD6RDD6_9ROSI|nr:hypothetical protein NC653_006059 [Populus alba x Populus x berolinensis]
MERREDRKIYREEMIKGLMRERERWCSIYTEREDRRKLFIWNWERIKEVRVAIMDNESRRMWFQCFDHDSKTR